MATLAAGNQIRVEDDGSSVVTGYAPGEFSAQPDALLLKVDAAGQTGCDTPLQLQVLEESPQFDSTPTFEATPSTPKVAAAALRQSSLAARAEIRLGADVCGIPNVPGDMPPAGDALSLPSAAPRPGTWR